MSHRNEPARERRRRQLKQDLSVTTIPLDEKTRRLTLDNHFGWMVMQKCQVGDGSIPRYPQLVQYHEKPDKYGPDYNKVTYVLYLNEKEDVLGKKEMQVQTSQRNVKLTERIPSARKEEKEKVVVKEKKEKKHHKEKEKPVKRSREDSPKGQHQLKKKLIDTFYYKKRGDSPDRIFRSIDSKDDYKLPESNPVEVANYTTDYVPGNKKPKKEKGRTAPKSWQLRAGADNLGVDGEELESILKTDSNLYYSTRGGRFTTSKAREGELLGELLSKNNKYLDISKDRVSREGESPSKNNEYLDNSKDRVSREGESHSKNNEYPDISKDRVSREGASSSNNNEYPDISKNRTSREGESHSKNNEYQDISKNRTSGDGESPSSRHRQGARDRR